MLLVWFALHLAVTVQPLLLYQAARPPFLTTPEFLTAFLRQCGGLARYLGLWLAQFDAFGWPGTLARVAQALALGLLTEACCRRLLGRAAPWLRLLPVIGYMLLCGRYDQWPAVGPAVILLLGVALVFANLPGRPDGARAVAYLVTLGLFGWLGAGALGRWHTLLAMLVLGALCAGFDRRWWYLLPAAASGVVAWRWCFALPGVGWLAVPQANLGWANVLTLGLLGGYLLLALASWLPLPARWRRPAPLGGKHLALAVAGVLWAANLLALRVTFDRAGQRAARFDYWVVHEQWDELIAHGDDIDGVGVRQVLNCHDLDLALFERGRLAEEMFRYPQQPLALMLPAVDDEVLPLRWRLADQALRLGRSNDAEHVLDNTLRKAEDDPLLLRQMAFLQLVRGNAAAARLYLRRLACNPAQRGWAEQRWRQLAADPGLVSDEQIQALRRRALTIEDLLDPIENGGRGPKVGWPYYSQHLLVSQLRSNPSNRLAYEWQMGLCLLSGRPEQTLGGLEKLAATGATHLPRAWEEGLLVALDRGAKPPALGRLSISAEGRQRHARFRAVLARHPKDLRGAHAEALRECPGSYQTWLLGMQVGRAAAGGGP